METAAIALENISLLQARLEFFILMSTDLEPFLREFHGNGPLAPFLYEQLRATLSKLPHMFVKADVLENAKRGSDVLKIDLEQVPTLRRS